MEFMEQKIGSILDDESAMSLALKLARRGWGRVSPNPLVGCVVLDSQNKLLSVGAHLQLGGSHAEVEALNPLSPSQLHGAKVYVTLEPCAHFGRTPPCAQTLAKWPLKEVVYGSLDPNPKVAGKGLQILREAGISVRRLSQFTQRCQELAEHFFVSHVHKRTFVSLKMALSLDSQMASASGDSRWITGAQARNYAHFLRAGHDALMVGSSTVLQDDPNLNIRYQEGGEYRFRDLRKKVFVLDYEAKVLRAQFEEARGLNLFKHHGQEHLHFFTDPKHLKGLKLPDSALQIHTLKKLPDLGPVLDQMWQASVQSLMVEGGPRLIKSFIEQKKFDRLYLFYAPLILGSASGRSPTEGIRMERMTQGLRLEPFRVRKLGSDVVLTTRREVPKYVSDSEDTIS